MRSETHPLPYGEAEIATARRVNQRWIVRGSLRANAEAWMNRLAATDPARLERSCSLALRLTRQKKGGVCDPKPLFYAGLFAEATHGEIRTYLAHHGMTRAISLLGHGDASAAAELPPAARELAERIVGEIRAARDKIAPA